MKSHFPHRFGYLNLDENFLYFTDTGNWKEARELSKKKHFSTNKALKKMKILGLSEIGMVLSIGSFIENALFQIGLVFCMLVTNAIFYKFWFSIPNSPYGIVPKNKVKTIKFKGKKIFFEISNEKEETVPFFLKLKGEISDKMRAELSFVKTRDLNIS